MFQVKVLVVSFKGALAPPSAYLSTTLFMAVPYILPFISLHKSVECYIVTHHVLASNTEMAPNICCNVEIM